MGDGSNCKDDLAEKCNADVLAKANGTMFSETRKNSMKRMRDDRANVLDATAVLKREALCCHVQLQTCFRSVGGSKLRDTQADGSDFGGGEHHAPHFA